MRFVQYVGAAVAALMLASGSAYAGLCQAPFMHDGGQVQLSGSGGMQMGADLAFSEVKTHVGDSCEARVQGVATFGLAGLPPSKSSLDYWMSVKNGQASFERLNAQGKREPVNGKFDLRMLGLFAYGVPITKAGQTFPAMRFQINLDHKAVQTQPIVVNTGLKKVGDRRTIETASGNLSCWPIRYTRITDPTQASFNGLVLPVPGMTSAVTDWFCPDVQMVMKQESEQGGVASKVEVTKLR